MLGKPSLEVEAVIADPLQRPSARMTTRERLADSVAGLGFVAAAVGLAIAAPPGGFALAPAFACFLTLVLAMRVRVDTPFGFTMPTQLAFVPLLFALPLSLVPVAVVAASVMARVPEAAAGELRPSRLVQTVADAWFAIGPAAVFALARVAPANAGAGLLIAALAGQFAIDFGVSGVRLAIGRGAGMMAQLSETWVYVVDAALSGVALLVAEQLHHTPVVVLAPLPLLGLIALFARERRQRLESLLELNGAYRRARDEAVEASNLKSAFLANVSHEIRTPMNGVMGMNELLLGTPLTEEQRAYAEQVSRSSEHMLAIINDILDISKIENGRLEIDVLDFDLRETVEQACTPAQLQAQTKGVALEVALARGTPTRVRGDGARLRQVLMNLVSNAVKFTAEGSVSVTVSRVTGDLIRFEVLDTGIGIEPAIIDRMFEPFMQADVSTTRTYGGNGLGLAIAKELVELMGGTIGASSSSNQKRLPWSGLLEAPIVPPINSTSSFAIARPSPLPP